MISAIGSSSYATRAHLYEYLSQSTRSEQADIGTTANPADTVEISLTSRAYNLLKVRHLSNEQITDFQSILARADQAPDAKSFLKSLSGGERELVRRANSYGLDLDDSHIEMMTQEGARNMLVQPDYRAFVDLNNDGAVDHGVGKTFSFPPPNAPGKVKDAWDKTVASLPEKERLLASSIFLVQSLQANGKLDEKGKPVGFYQPGEEGFKNIFPTSTEEWFPLLDKVDEYLDWSEKVNPGNREQIAKDRHLIELFTNNLTGSNSPS